MFRKKNRKLLNRIKMVCKQYETELVHNNFKLLNEMYDSKYTLRLGYKLLCEFGDGNITGGSRTDSNEVYEIQ